MSLGWPDILIGAILLLAGLKGLKRGFVMELAGFVALILSLITPWFYNGQYDRAIEAIVHTSSGAAHVIAMVLVGVATYAAVMIVARILSAVARLPVIGLGNALGGAAIGLLKGTLGVWIVLYIALFFPLTHAIRSDLHRSVVVQLLTQPDASIDRSVIETLPPFARPILQPVFARHHA